MIKNVSNFALSADIIRRECTNHDLSDIFNMTSGLINAYIEFIDSHNAERISGNLASNRLNHYSEGLHSDHNLGCSQLIQL